MNPGDNNKKYQHFELYQNINILNFNSYFPLSLHFWSTDFSQELEKIKMVNYKHFVFLEQTTPMLETPASACAEKAVRC